MTMNCVCGFELIHGGDHDAEEYGHDGNEWTIVSNLSCPDCGRFFLAYTPAYKEEDDD